MPRKYSLKFGGGKVGTQIILIFYRLAIFFIFLLAGLSD